MTATSGSARFQDNLMNATKQLLNIGLTAIEVAVLVAEVGREVPIASAVLGACIAVHNMVEMVHVRTNKNDLVALRERCSYLTAWMGD